MTEKLYYRDPYLQTFSAAVLSCEAHKGGYAVVLDKTAFYPEGGGQPADQGRLGEAVVSDVRGKEGNILPLCDRPLEVGARVSGVIDWERRFDHMQQHSGEHIISGMICKRFSCSNVGFHLGKDTVTIDFDTVIPPDELRLVEQAANEYIWSNAANDIHFLEGEALEQAEYRSKKFIPGQVRLVAFPGADRCACCGTHVSSAGQVGLIHVLSCDAFRSGVRIQILCGKRAWKYLDTVARQNVAVSQQLSAKPHETSAAVEKLLEARDGLKDRLAQLETAECARKARQYQNAGDVLLVEPPMSADGVRRLCDAVLSTCGGRCAVFAGEGESYAYAIGHKEQDVRPLVKELNAALKGRGGGKPNFAQGSVSASESAIRAFFNMR